MRLANYGNGLRRRDVEARRKRFRHLVESKDVPKLVGRCRKGRSAAHDSQVCPTRARRAIPGPASVRALVVAAVRATRMVDVLVPSHPLEGSNGAHPHVEVRLPLRTHLRVRAAAGTHDLVVRRRARRHRHGRHPSRSLGWPDDRDDMLTPRVRSVDDAVAGRYSVAHDGFEHLDHHFQTERRLVCEQRWFGASWFHSSADTCAHVQRQQCAGHRKADARKRRGCDRHEPIAACSRESLEMLLASPRTAGST
jgi:hypothetical protein